MTGGMFSIGAKFEKAQLTGDFTEASEMIKSATEGWSMAFESSKKATREAAAAMQESVRTFAQNVNVDAVKAAESLKELASAQGEVRMASKLMKDSTVDSSMGILAMASAQEKLAIASAEAASAIKRLAASTAAAAGEEVLSSNVIVASFQQAALGVQKSCTSIQEKLVQTAETSKLSAEGMTAGFAGLGSLLGAGIFVGFAAHFLDETAKMEVELGHLSEKTKIAVADLAGLQAIVKEQGGDFEAISTGLTRMIKNLSDSTPATKQLTEAVAGLGLNLQELKDLHNPEAALQQLAAAFAKNTDAGRQNAAAIALLGRGGMALVPILVSQGAALLANMIATGKLTGVTDQTLQSAKAWMETTARLSMEFRSTMVPTIGYAEQAIAKLAAAIQLISAYIYGLVDLIVPLAQSLKTVGGVIYDAMTGNFGALKNDTKELTHDLAMSWEDYGHRVAGHIRDANERWNWKPGGSISPAAGGADTGDPGNGGAHTGDPGNGGGRGRRSSAAAASAPAASAPAGAEPGGPQTQSSDLSGGGADMIAGLQQQVKATQDAVKQETVAYRAQAEEKIRMAAEDYADFAKSTEEKVRLGTMSEQQRIAALRAGSDQEYKIRQQQSAFIQMLDMGDMKKYEQYLKQQEDITRQHARQIQQLNAEIATKQQQQYSQMFAAITGPLNAFTDHWLTSGQRMGAALQKMYDQMAMNFINSEMKMLQHHLQMELQKRMISITSDASQVTSASAAAATTTALETKAATQSLAKSAAVAAGKAWSALAGIPIVGPVLGAVAAGATYAGIMAMAAFEQGGVVQGGGRMGVPILAHAGERVLSQSQTQNFESMVNQSTSSKSSEVHFHDNSNWNGVDGASVQGMYRQHAASARREMLRQLRLANQI